MKFSGYFDSINKFHATTEAFEGRAISADIPPKILRENRCLIDFIPSAIRMNWMQFPFRVDGGESPDFSFILGAKTIGIEITRAANSAYNELRNQDNPESAPIDGVLCSFISIEDRVQNGLNRKDHGISKKSYRERNSGLKAAANSPIQIGNDPEKIWLPYIIEAISVKSKKRAKHYKKLDSYWLLIIDETPVGWRNLACTKPLLENYIQTQKEALGGFQKVAIQTYLMDVNNGESPIWIMLKEGCTSINISSSNVSKD